MRVLITGATGLVGTHISDLCARKGYDVHYLTTGRGKIEKKPGYTGFYWDPEKGEIDSKSFEGVDAIIHLAGASVAKRWTQSYKEEIINSRVKSAGLLYDTLLGSGTKISHFISASGISVYPSSLRKLYFEDEPEVDDSFLGEVVEIWETAADQFSKLGMKVSKLRTGLVLATEGGALPKIKEPISYNAGAAFGSGKQWQSWIHIQDLARMYLFILEKNLEGVYNAVAPNPVTNKELVKMIAGSIGKKIWLPNIPATALKLALGEMSSTVLASQLVSSNKIEKAGFDFRYKNLPKALEDLL